METRRNTTAGVVFWTPAPVRTSPSNSVISEDAWEDEDEEQAEDDFVSQMDENGIIGLSEALEEVELGETCGDVDAECNPDVYPGSLTREEAESSGCERDTPPEELSYNLSEHLSHGESAGEDVQILLSSYDMISSLKAWREDEEMRQGTDHLPERDRHLDMVEQEKGGDDVEKRRDRTRKKYDHASTSGELVAADVGVSSHHCLVSQSASAVAASTLPHLLHFTAEELAAAPGIDAETFPEMGFTESLPESQCSHISPRSSPRCPEITPRASLQPAATFSGQVMSSNYGRVSNVPGQGSGKSDKHHKQPVPRPRKTRKHSPEATYSGARSDSFKSKQLNASRDRESRTPRARSNADVVDESRKGPLSYHTPDFSQVEPRVRFPKGGYKPPKSRHSFTVDSLSPEPPLVFKSPADIVKEVLLNTADGCPAPSDCNRPPPSATNSTVPQEFRCRQQATTLLEQLQEDYNRLLTKYADAENTIDRLRLEAKVNLYSDPPKAGHCVQSGLNHDTSKFIKLAFPQAQKAEINSASLCPNGHSTHQGSTAASPSPRSPDPQLGQQLANILFNQTDKFLQQLQTFEDLLKSDKLKPSEQVKGLSHLAEGLDSLQRGYLLARNDHKVLQQRGAGISHFDPERELEGLIFQCGLRMEDLEEQVEGMQQEQPTCEAPPSPPPQPTPSSATSERGETLAHPQSPPVPLLLDPGEAADVEVSSASKESDEEEAEDEETLNSLYLKPLHGKHRCVEPDFVMPVDHYQSFKELPKLLDHNLRERAPLSAALRTDMKPGDKTEERQSQGTGNNEVRKPVPQRTAKSDHQDSPVGTSKQWSSRSSPPSCRASSQSTTPPAPPPRSRRRFEVGKSHSSSLSSLGDIAASERRSSKVQAGSRRVLSQDGIISPETDSGFVGSESSRLTPAAAPSPLHQRALESVSGPEEGNSGRPQTGPVSASSPSSSPPYSHVVKEPRVDSRLSPEQLRGTRQGQRRRTFSCSPQRWVSAEFGLESDSAHTGSEGEQSDRYTRSIDSLHSSHSSSSPAARYHHGDPLSALSSSQVVNCKDAIQTLQAEVARLTGSLESCLSNRKPLSTARAATSAQENCSYHNTSTPRSRPEEQRSAVSGGRRETEAVDEVEEGCTLRRAARKRAASAHRQKPQHDILTRSELQSSTPQPRPQTSRSTQTSAAPDSRCSHSTTVGSGRTQTRQHPVVSVQVSETADETDSRGRAPLCPQCSSRHRGRSERPAGGNREPTHASSTSCRRCPLCGRLEPYRCTEPDCRRRPECPAHISCQPAESPDRAARRYFAATAPPALLQCTPVCPPQLLLYSSPLYVSPNNSTGTSSGVRGRGEVRSTRRSLDGSLSRAIRAARHMKHTSRHMARSLTTGLQYQQLLTQSCSY